MDLQNSLCPRRDDGGIDQRYVSTIKTAIELAGKETVDKLMDFSAATSEAEKAAAPHAVKLCLSVLMADKSDNKFVVQALKKQMRHALQEVGFKPSRATIVVTVAEFQKKLIDDNSQMAEWVSSQTTNFQYELACTNDKGLSIVWAELSKWGTEEVSRTQLRQVKAKHPKVEDETRGRRPNSGSRSTNSNPIQSTTTVAPPYVASDANKAQVDAMSAASPVTTESYAAPTPKAEESPASEVMVNDVVTITATTVAESSAAIASPIPSIDDNFYEAYEKAVFALKKGTLSDAEKAILHRIADLASNFGLGRLPRR
jgi:hypothetical protein